MSTAGGQGADQPQRAAPAVDARRALGSQVGDHGTLINNFYPADGPVTWPVRVGAVPGLADCYQMREEAGVLDRAVGPGGTTVLTQVLSGLGGVGKSQLAAAYVRSWAQRVDVLVWVTARSREAVLSTYALTAGQLGYRGQDGPAGAAWLLSWLQSTERDWLVVLDDLADPADLAELWPEGPRGRTLVTTRRTDAVLSSRGRRRITVGLFSPEEARSYLVAKLGAEPGSARVRQVDELAADLGYLPLALAQAAAFILDYEETCAGYRARLADRRRSLADLFPPAALADDYRATVAATWSMSIQAADQLVPAGVSRPLLQIASVLDPNGVPADVVQTDAVINYVSAHRTTTESGASPQHATVSEQDCRDGLRNLARLSLVNLDPGGGSTGLRVHALVQRATLEHLDQHHLTALLRAAAAGLMQAWPEIERDPQFGQVLRANAAMLAEGHPNALWEPDAHQVLFRAGRSLGECGLVSAAVEHWTQMEHHAIDILGADHPDTLSSRNNLARWRGEAGNAAGAATALRELLTDRLRVLGPDHPHTLSTRHNLAYWRGAAGDAAGAATAFRELFTDRLRVLGPDHPHTLSTRSNLARWRGAAGDAAEAATALRELLTDRLRVLGPDHPHTLSTRHNLARWRGAAGDAAEAATAFQELLTDYLRVLGPDHPHTLSTRHNLAYWRGAAGDAAGAATALRELLTDYLRALGPDHPDTLITRSHLARWRGAAGDTAGAATAFRELLTDRLRVLGPDHPHTLSTRHNLAHWQRQADQK